MTFLRRIVALAVVISCLWASPAFAQGSIEEAQRYFDQGAQFYFEGEYSRAIVEFRKAQEAHPHPIFLYNIAMASFQLGRFDRALEAALAAEAMDDPLPPEQQARNLGIIRGAQALQDSRAAADAVARHQASRPVAQADDDVEGPVIEPPPKTGGSFGARGWGGVAALGAGAGALAYAAMLDMNIRGGEQELEELRVGNNEAAFDDLKSSLQSQQRTGQIMLFGGIGLAALGTGLLVWELTSSPGQDTAITFSVAPQPTGVSFSLRW